MSSLLRDTDLLVITDTSNGDVSISTTSLPSLKGGLRKATIPGLLTESEQGPTMARLSSRGDLSFNELGENYPIRPADAFFFPLSGGLVGYDLESNPSLSPSRAENVVFDPDGCFIGRTLTNVWPNKTLEGLPQLTTLPAALHQNASRTKTIIPAGESTFSLASNSISVTSGSFYTVGLLQKKSAGFVTNAPHISLNKGSSLPIAHTVIHSQLQRLSNTWTRSWITVQANETVAASPTVSYSTQAEVALLSVEAKPFVSAYTGSSRGNAILQFSLRASLNLSWAVDYTIGYWKRVHGTATNGTSSGTSLDSLGLPTNTVGGGFRSFGKGAAMTHGIVSANQTVPIPSLGEYQYRWLFHVIRRTGNTLTYRTYSEDGLFSNIEIAETTTAPNRYVNQLGYDFHLGGSNNDAATANNAYYRDLFVVQRSVTNLELESLWKNRLGIGLVSKFPSLCEGE